MLTTEVPIIYDIVDNLFALGANWASKLLAQIPTVWTLKKHTSPGWKCWSSDSLLRFLNFLIQHADFLLAK